MGTMRYVELMLYASFVIVATLLILILGPQAFFGYLLYLIGWLMAGSGYFIVGNLYINSTYLLAIYPIAYYAHLFFWKIFLAINNMKQGGNINNLLVRLITLGLVSVFFLFCWYAIGHFLMSQGVKMTLLSPLFMDSLAWLNTKGVSFWACLIVTVISYTFFFVKIVAIAWSRQSKIEGLVHA